MEVYLPENLRYMRQREKLLAKYHGRSPQLKERRFLVDWICLKGEKFALPKSAIHLAVVILDRFMDCHDITTQSLEFICLAALTLASKFDCKETTVPKYKKFKSVLSSSSNTSRPPPPPKASDFRSLEGMILAFFKWNIFIPTATHYVDLLIEQVLHPTDVVNGTRTYTNYMEVRERLVAFVHYFLDISMQVRKIYTAVFGLKS